jgi:ketosteroid isomerase-like protein
MADRQQMEQTLRQAYAARCCGDSSALGPLFRENALFRLAGAPQASPIASEVRGAQDIQAHVHRLIETFAFSDHEILSMVIDGNKAAVHWRATVHANATGERATTEFFDLVEFDDDRIASFTQFCDTALAKNMLRA